MRTRRDHSGTSRIDVTDEMEFKLWVKFIASVYKSGGNIDKPSDILWKSVIDEISFIRKKGGIKS